MATVALEFSRAMLAEGASMVFFSSRQRPAGTGDWKAQFIFSPHRHELANKLYWLPRVEPLAGVDVVFYPYWPASPLRSSQAPPSVVYVHDLAFRLRPEAVPWQQRLYLGRLIPAALRSSALIFTPSEATRQDLLLAYPRHHLSGRVMVIPPGSALDAVTPGAVPAGLPEDFVLAVGTIEPRKNYPILLEAHRRLADRPPLVVVGQRGWGSADIVRGLEQDPKVVLLGHTDDATLRALYRRARLLVFPSLYEGFGLPLLEAMAEGLPAVVSSAGALSEVAGGAALLVRPDDPAAIADAMRSVLDDPGLAARLSERGRARAAQFSWRSSARRALELLAQVR